MSIGVFTCCSDGLTSIYVGIQVSLEESIAFGFQRCTYGRRTFSSTICERGCFLSRFYTNVRTNCCVILQQRFDYNESRRMSLRLRYYQWTTAMWYDRPPFCCYKLLLFDAALDPHAQQGFLRCAWWGHQTKGAQLWVHINFLRYKSQI